ncbi:AlkA N-terminal domain-containing protein [Dictyobacter formicarum]|uniref:DNA-3-methyladenine glycosylase II n=1 Tax=Dictyobacter formicarum TaxID=2778368 RepID=A0ABQ3V7U4_9CHLR|nr:AlkA N-terminal domain-containing protein [Dictyobacter formicarum]GHO82202.1 DNA-3-methyladenine glycosylase [Dictyobacter formicarum]
MLASSLSLMYHTGMETQHITADFDLCYKATRSRDARFDGQFFVAVVTTGIYCRPICPAPMPSAQHIRFYSCAAAAEAAGFRACRRCHPEASPGSPEWNIRADLVARALRLIADGVVDVEGVSGLAQRLVVSERHLHRELLTAVGVGPLALARTRRAQTARLLIDQTDLSLTTIAFTAGFSSIRQFNETMHATFGCAPSSFRRNVSPPQGGEGKLILRLSYRPPFESATLLTYLGRRALPGVEEVTNRCYRRTISLPQSKGIIELEPKESANVVLLRLQLSDLSDLSLLVQRCRQLFDLDADPAMIAEVLGADSLLAPLVKARPGLRIPGTMDGFELAVRAIADQWMSVADAQTVLGRLARELGEALDKSVGTLSHFFPSPQLVLTASLREIGVTGKLANALQTLARVVIEEKLVLSRDADREQTIARLLRLPEMRPWTVSSIATRALGDPDAYPLGDPGLQRAFAHHGLAMDTHAIKKHAEAWRPWRAYALHHLWASLPPCQPDANVTYPCFKHF